MRFICSLTDIFSRLLSGSVWRDTSSSLLSPSVRLEDYLCCPCPYDSQAHLRSRPPNGCRRLVCATGAGPKSPAPIAQSCAFLVRSVNGTYCWLRCPAFPGLCGAAKRSAAKLSR
jgi:hypothetical protein